MSRTSPIGIFDSGMGGLTVAHAIFRLLPNEHLIYYGDTKHLPYGDKSEEAIKQYSEQIFTYLLERDCKAIVIACNSASTAAGAYLDEKFGNRVPIINVVDPLVHAVTAQELKEVGLIATKATIQSQIYQNALQHHVKVVAKATPLLVPMIEEGFVDDEVSRTILSNYLSGEDFKNIDALLLACTHYPLIKKTVQQYLPHAQILDSTQVTAQALKDLLQRLDLTSEVRNKENEFIISDYTETFDQQAQIFFGQNIDLKMQAL